LKIYELFEKPMVNLLAKMEIEGIKINSSFLKVLSKKFDNKIKLDKYGCKVLSIIGQKTITHMTVYRISLINERH